MKSKTYLKERLTQLRKETGLNQRDFAADVGFSQSKYNKWENGINEPEYDSLCLLADRLGVTTDYLLGRSDGRSHEHMAFVDAYALSDQAAEILRNYKETELNGVENTLLHKVFPGEKATYGRIISSIIEDQTLVNYLVMYVQATDAEKGTSYTLLEQEDQQSPENTLFPEKMEISVLERSSLYLGLIIGRLRMLAERVYS